MSFVIQSLKQKAVLWAFSAYEADGTPKVVTGVEIPVRWEFKTQDVIDSQGRTIRSDAFAMLDRDVVVHSLMWLGASADLPADLADITDVYEVFSFRKIPTIKGTHYQRTAILIRYKDSLPTIV